MKEYGSAAPVLSDFSTLSDLDIMEDVLTSEPELDLELEPDVESTERSTLTVVRTHSKRVALSHRTVILAIRVITCHFAAHLLLA